MAPPAGAMAAAGMDEEGVLEVRCAGCGDTLEVELGLTEFACPGCAMPQGLPPELMPPPRRPRRALPLGPAAAPTRVSCGGCGAVLAVPRGIRRLACPLCGTELALECRIRPAAHSGVQIISPPGAVAVSATSSRQPEEKLISQAIRIRLAQVGTYNKSAPFPDHLVREESISSFRSDTRTAVRVDWAKSLPVNQSVHGEEAPDSLLNKTVDGHDFWKNSRPSASHGFDFVNKVKLGYESMVIHAPQAQEGPSNHVLHTEEAHEENQRGTIRRTGIQKDRCAVSCIVEQETVEPPSQTSCTEQAGIESCYDTTQWNQKRKRSCRIVAGVHKGKERGLSSSSKEIHLTSSKRTQTEGIRNRNPIQLPASSANENQFDPADTDTIINRLCPSALPQKRVLQASSDDLDNIDAILQPVSINHGTSQGDCFPHGYRQHRVVAIGSLSNHGFIPAQGHEMPQESLNRIGSHDKNSTQVSNLSVGSLHRQLTRKYPSQSQVQIGSHHNKILGHFKIREKGSMHMLNEGDYIGEQPHTGTNQQVTLVTASSNRATSPPLLTATALPVPTSPSVVSGPAVQQPPPQYPSSHIPHSQVAQTVGIGSINRSTKKRRGRGPTKLIDPRRESDRPVLTPNNADTWDVDPPCPKVASTISALLKQWYPGSTYMLAKHTNEVHQAQLILHWHQYHSDTKAIITDEFLQRYKWAPGQEALCLKLFDHKLVRQFTVLLCDEKRRARVELAASRKAKEALDAARSKQANSDDEYAAEELKRRRDPASVGREDDDPLQWKPFPPEWMQPKWWEMICEHWASEEVLQVSAQKRKNRYTGGSAQHTAGSRSIVMHRKLMIIENGGKPVSDIEVFNKTHKRDGGKGEFVTEKAKRTVERIKRRLEEAGDTELDPHLVWAQEVGGRSRGRYYGLHGIIDKARVDAMAKSTPKCLKTQKNMFTHNQVLEMISQATQQLNEAWEKRFRSLELRIHGMVSSEAPQHAPWPVAAGPVAEEGQASHQDGSDSSDEGIYQSATDDDDDYVEN